MVEWKGKLEGDVGEKASLLDRIDAFPVPNFFVITPDEVSQLFKDVRDHERVLNAQVKGEVKNDIKDAYEDIGMSSEVRTAAGRAKNLVGGQRNNQLVSIRISGRGQYEYRLNIGSSNLFRSIKEVAASYYEENDDDPSIIVQKMVEADYSGAAIDSNRRSILEVVEGLGKSLEEGISTPHLYMVERNEVIEKRKAERQLKVTRNPINGDEKRKNTEPRSMPFSDQEVEELFEKISSSGMNLKFAYKRGDFHIVDVWRGNPEIAQNGLNGVRVSNGAISGKVGRDIEFSDATIPSGQYDKALISRKGGYSSRDAEKAREKEKPAIFSFNGELENGQQIEISESSVKVKQKNSSKLQDINPFSSGKTEQKTERTPEEDNDEERVEEKININATEVLPINPSRGRGLHLSPPYGKGFTLGNSGKGNVDRQGYVNSFRELFAFENENLIFDTRGLEPEGLLNAIEYIEADLKILVVDNPSPELLQKAVEEDFDVIAAEERTINSVKRKVARAEKKFMIDRLRDLD
ncbi:MAG: hypothetical protein H8Z69_01520 [Nanohaloarchaea archaeon]|nr:hypothetical protein [Candidatus Nanohaloarchaea archaeon]